ncbi:MAG: hypothetical protein ACTHJ4_04365 [Candidatus Nucleicultricaceae bacterium]
MSINEDFIEDFGKILKKYQIRMEVIFQLTESSVYDDPSILEKLKHLNDLFQQAKDIFSDLKLTRDEEWGIIHNKAIQILNALKTSFYDVLTALKPTMPIQSANN